LRPWAHRYPQPYRVCAYPTSPQCGIHPRGLIGGTHCLLDPYSNYKPSCSGPGTDPGRGMITGHLAHPTGRGGRVIASHLGKNASARIQNTNRTQRLTPNANARFNAMNRNRRLNPKRSQGENRKLNPKRSRKVRSRSSSPSQINEFRFTTMAS
jgi:hypothetical protein